MAANAQPRPPHPKPDRTEYKSPHNRFAVISDGVRQGRLITRVIYGEGTFTLLDAEMADEDPDEHGPEAFHAVCLDCLLCGHPEAGRGMDVARRAGSSRFHAWMWMEEM